MFIIRIFIIALVIGSFISVAYAEKNTLKYYSVVPDKLNVRLEPNKKAEVIGLLYKYQKVDILEVKGGWAKIHQCNNLLNENISNNTCWVSINYLFPVTIKQLKTTPNIVKQQQKIFSQTNLIVLSIFIILGLFLYAYFWKKTIINFLIKIDKKTHYQFKNINENNSVKSDNSIIDDNLSTQILEIKNQLDALQKYSLENKEKIRRFEYGYDLKIQNEFVIDIINTIAYLEKQNKKSKNNDLEAAIEDLDIMLENNSIYKIELNTDDYRGQEISAKVASTELTSDPSKHYAIKEVVKSGYYIEINETKKVIKPAEVVIYKIKEKE